MRRRSTIGRACQFCYWRAMPGQKIGTLRQGFFCLTKSSAVCIPMVDSIESYKFIITCALSQTKSKNGIPLWVEIKVLAARRNISTETVSLKEFFFCLRGSSSSTCLSCLQVHVESGSHTGSLSTFEPYVACILSPRILVTSIGPWYLTVQRQETTFRRISRIPIGLFQGCVKCEM